MLKELSPAEREVFDLRVEGYKLDEIADKLHKEPGTIKNQNNSMLRRYKCHSFEELMDKLGYEPRY